MKFYNVKYCLYLFIVVSIIILGTTVAKLNEKDEVLEKNKKLSVFLNRGGANMYELPLNSNTEFHVIIKSTGIDVGIELISPNNKVLNRINEYSFLRGLPI